MSKKPGDDCQALLSMEEDRQRVREHPPYYLELEMTHRISAQDETGALSVMREIGRMQRASLSENPLRSLKDSLICSCTLFTRAALAGGAPMNAAFSLSDACIRVIERTSDPEALTEFEGVMIHRFIELERRQSTHRTSGIVDSAVDYVSRHLMEPLTVKQVALGAYVHPDYLSTCFRRETGITLTRYIQRERVRRAQDMLRRGHDSIAAIAAACQFCSQSHFTQVFRRLTGETPEQFRRARAAEGIFEHGGKPMKLKHEGFSPERLAVRETLFHVANGYLGVRASLEEGAPEGVRTIRGAYINAFFDTADIAYGERLYGFARQQQSIVNITDIQTVRLTLAGERFSPFEGEVLSWTQELDMDEGVYTRRVLWRSPEGRTTELCFERMASFVRRELFTLCVSVSPVDWSGAIGAESTQNGGVMNDSDPTDPRKLSEKRRLLSPVGARVQGDDMLMLCKTSRSELTMASAVRHSLSAGLIARLCSEDSENICRITGSVAPERTAQIVKWCVFTDSRRYENPEADALRILGECAANPPSTWRDMQKAFLSEFWRRSRVEIQGDDALAISLHYSVYSLLQSAGRDSVSNIASKGLSGEGYEGHYFWDTEIYMFPFFLLTNREIARSLLEYRCAALPFALEHARLLGHKQGALYPWRTIAGSECSAYFPSGSAQYHINGDIAHAFIDYWRVTGDLHFFAHKGMRVLIETARLWLDAGHFGRDGAFHIDCVTGPDEYTCLVNDNHYTNQCARHHLRGVLHIARALEEARLMDDVRAQTNLQEGELEAFEAAADAMALPFDETLGILKQDSSFLEKKPLDIKAIPPEHFPLLLHYHPMYLYRHQVCKQADTVLAMLLFGGGLSPRVMADTYDYYERITTHDSSLSACVFSMVAARLGRVREAYQYYSRTACLDLEDTHRNTADGIHAANMGGGYMGIVFGFAGLRIEEDGISLRPCIPSAWQGYRFRLSVQGTLLQVAVTAAEIALRRLEGPSIELKLYDNPIRVEDSLIVPVALEARV